MTKLHELAALGQAIWYDYIRRSFIRSGELQALVNQGVRGVTSNPTIFERAIAGSNDYDEDLRRLVDQGQSVAQIYEALTMDDIRRAAGILRPFYDASGGHDGYVSLEVSPTLAHDTGGTVAEARRLFAALDCPNVMIKVPATSAGPAAIETLIGEGINVNVTLIFSIAQYEAVAEAYLRGLEKRADTSSGGGDLRQVASVASFFVSRVDTATDQALDKLGDADLKGKAAIANAKAAYARFCQLFSGPRWQRLALRGAQVQRPLWASTGTKNPHYPDTLYVDSLIGPDTVNTIPPATLTAFLDHGVVAPTLAAGMDEAQETLARLAIAGVDLKAITEQLQKDAVAAFAQSFETLTASIGEKRQRLLAPKVIFDSRFLIDNQKSKISNQELPTLTGWPHITYALGAHQPPVERALADIKADQIISRIWSRDYTVWKPEPAEIANRLGWLHIAEMMSEHLQPLRALADSARAAGYTHALLLGMGGSSLAPDLFRRTFGVADGYLDLAVLDSTDPGAVLAYSERLDPRRTLYIVSTKSGGTVETFSFFRYFYQQTLAALGAEEAGRHFVAITDPGSQLAEVAAQYRFRAALLNDPNIGGRYSALSTFGLAPAALMGVDVPRLLERALRAASACEPCVAAADNPGARLGAAMGELAQAGRDKITFILSPELAGFGDWVEQLIAESTGKEGRGILPVSGEPLGAPAVYRDDRVFVQIALEGDTRDDTALAALTAAGHPLIRVRLQSPYDLGGQLFLWEFATAVAGWRLGINPFDQPNVESAKVLTRQILAASRGEAALPSPIPGRGVGGEAAPAVRSGDIAVYGDVQAETPGDALKAFLEPIALPSPILGRGAGGEALRPYVALQAYIQPTPETDAALYALRARIQSGWRVATTVGYGPRFLHSTGQLHKGDGGHGFFIQFTADMPRDAAIPDDASAPASSISFGVLKTAQVLGDGQALTNRGRRVIRFHLGADAPGALRQLADDLV